MSNGLTKKKYSIFVNQRSAWDDSYFFVLHFLLCSSRLLNSWKRLDCRMNGEKCADVSYLHDSCFRRKARVLQCKPGVPDVERGNWGWECDRLLYLVSALREQCKYTECCVLWRKFVKNHALYVHLACKDVDRFRNRSVLELYCSKGHQISKVRARFCEIAINGPCTSSNMLEEHFSCWKKWRIVANRASKIKQT